MSNPFVRILVAAAVLVFALSAFVLREQAARAAGTEVVLPMEAVDPRGLLTGHYVRLNLAQRLAPGAPCPAGSGEWMALRPAGGRHIVAARAASRAEALRLGPVAVRGELACREDFGEATEVATRQLATLDIGIDRFHASQAEAERIEAALRAQAPGEEPTAAALVSVGRDGRARLKGLIVEGRRLDLGWW